MKLTKVFLCLFFFTLTLWGNKKADELLLTSATECNIEGVKRALREKASVNAKTSYNDTALMFAAQKGCLEAVKILVKKGANVNASNKWGDTALHMAAMSGNLELIKFLVSKKADIYSKNYLKYTPMFYAAIMGHLECLKYFVEECKMDIEERDKIGLTLLIRVAYQKNEYLEIVKYLVEKGAFVNAKSCNGKYRALHYAAMRGHNQIVEFLLKNKANVNAKSVFGETALDLALKNKRILAAKIIRRYGGVEGAKY